QDASLATPPAAAADGTAPQATPGAAAANTTLPGIYATREEALAASPRVPIDTVALSGSISLTGGRIDDLRLKRYTETVDPDSPIVTLLSPSGGPGGYYVENGWEPPQGVSLARPDAASVWTLEGDAQTLTTATPVTLRWDNGAGLVFRRTITVDENYLFTITQSVENTTGGDVMLYPYSRVVRQGTPHTANF